MIKENSPKQLELLKQFDEIVKAWGKYPTVDDLQSKFKIYGKIRYNFGNYGNLIDEYELWKHSSEVFEDRYEEANNTLEEDSVFLKEIYKYKNLLKYERKNKDLLLKQITETSGFPRANPRPLAVAEPIRSPVKDPGPPATAMASIVERSSSII